MSFNLEDLKGENSINPIDTTPINPDEVHVLDIDEFMPPKEEPDPNVEFFGKMSDTIDSALDRNFEDMEEAIDEGLEQLRNKIIDGEIKAPDEITEELDMHTPVEKSKTSSENEEDEFTIDYSIFDEDSEFLKELDNEIYGEDTDDENEMTQEEAEEKAKEQLNHLSSMIRETITPVQDKIDLTKFTINKKPVSMSKVIAMQSETVNVADWVLYSSKRPISMSEFTGVEIDKLDPSSNKRNRYNTYRDIYTLFYKHLVDDNKPATVDAWAKTVNFFDIQNLYMAAYMATFNGANAIPYSCEDPKCGEMFMEEHNIDDMIKYETPEIEKEVKAILSKSTNSPDVYEVELFQMSNDYIVGLIEPTIYTAVLEIAALSEEFTNKYSDLLGVISYIDSIYFINRKTNTLDPISTNEDPTDRIKSTMRKIKIYYDVLSSLNSDQFYELSAHINAISKRNDGISFVIPASKCPKCGKEIAEAQRTAEQLLFTRHQLGALANIPKN